jgi:hypothetical protein
MANFERESSQSQDIKDEKKILIGLITNKEFFSSVRSKMTPDFFDAEYMKIIAGWCISFFDKVKDPPRVNIKDIYEKESMGLSESDAKLIDKLLLNLSDSFAEQGNEKYLEDTFNTLKEKKNVKALLDEATLYYRSGDIKGALRALRKRTDIEKAANKSFDIFSKERIVDFFRKDEDSRMHIFDGVAGDFFKYFKDEWFVSFQAPEKTGKSFVLEELAFNAVEAGYNVLVISVELSEEVLSERFYQRITGKGKDYERDAVWPVFDCKKNQHNQCQSRNRTSRVGCHDDTGKKLRYKDARGYKACSYCRTEGLVDFEPAVWQDRTTIDRMTAKDVLDAAKVHRKVFKGRLKCQCYPAFSATLTDIDALLDFLAETENFYPKFVIIDYVDILKPEGKEVGREKIDELWKQVKQLAQKKKPCIITVEQANKQSNFKITQDVGDVTEDKRKNAHVDAKYAINVTKEEKRDGAMRISCLFHRHVKFNPYEQLLCLRMLEIANSMIDCEKIEIEETEVQRFTYK